MGKVKKNQNTAKNEAEMVVTEEKTVDLEVKAEEIAAIQEEDGSESAAMAAKNLDEKIEADRLAREPKSLPRNIMCKGSHSYCSADEMSEDHPG